MLCIVTKYQSSKMSPAIKVCMKWRCVEELINMEKIAPTDIYQQLLYIYGDQTADVITV